MYLLSEMHELSLLYTRDSLGDTFRLSLSLRCLIGKETFQQMHFCESLYLFSLGGMGGKVTCLQGLETKPLLRT